jgi:hypothetical protein
MGIFGMAVLRAVATSFVRSLGTGIRTGLFLLYFATAIRFQIARRKRQLTGRVSLVVVIDHLAHYGRSRSGFYANLPRRTAAGGGPSGRSRGWWRSGKRPGNWAMTTIDEVIHNRA